MAVLMSWSPVNAGGDKKNRVLIFSAGSALLTDIQDRLFREEVLRRLHEKGIPVVPVMEMERFFGTGQNTGYRRAGRAELKYYSERLNAVAVVSVELKADGSSPQITGVEPGTVYRCSVVLYDSRIGDYTELEFKIQGGKTLHAFFSTVSERVADSIISILQ